MRTLEKMIKKLLVVKNYCGCHFERKGEGNLAPTSIFLAILILTFSLGALAASERVVVVAPGETLGGIAERELGGASRWNELMQYNNITDPRRVKPGQRIRIPMTSGSSGSYVSPPGGIIDREEPAVTASLPTFTAGAPSVRQRAGAVRFRSSVDAPWGDLVGSRSIIGGSSLMTANTGQAEIRVGDVAIDVGPFSILRVHEVTPGAAVNCKLDIGSIALKTSQSAVQVEADAGRIAFTNSEIRMSVDEAGLMKVVAVSGQVNIVGADGRTSMIPAGRSATLQRGGSLVMREPVSSITIISPLPGASVSERDIQFQWTAVTGATGYRFVLIPEIAGRPKLEQQITTNKLLVKNVPEGGYSWMVMPMGVSDAASTAPTKLVVARNTPMLELAMPELANGQWWLKGRTVPGAWLVIGDAATGTLKADADGNFAQSLGDVSGVLLVGVEARLTPGGAVTRRAVFITGHPDGHTCPLWVKVPSGRVVVNEEPAPPALSLAEGRNVFTWQWLLGDGASMEAAHGRFDLTVDMTPPLITAVRADPPRIKSGDEVTIYVTASDRGVGLAPPSAAHITITGPDGFHAEPNAERLTPNNEYVFRFSTPVGMRAGVLRVTSLEVSDADGNAILLSSDGMAIETIDPVAQKRTVFQNILMIGAGIAIGIAL